MTTLLRSSNENRKPNVARQHEGLGVDSMTLRIDLTGLPNVLASKPHNLQGWWSTERDRGRGWNASPHSRMGAGIIVTNVASGSGGKLACGEMIVFFSVAEILTRAEGGKGNIGKCDPALLRDLLHTLLSDLGDVFECNFSKVRVDEIDLIVDAVTDDPTGAIATLKGRTATIPRRPGKEGWSHEITNEPGGSVFIPRRAPAVPGNHRTTEATALYDKSRQLKRPDLAGLIRLEACHGTGQDRGCSTPTIKEICSADLWRRILGERLLELGLKQNTRLKYAKTPQAAADALMADGVPDVAAMAYAMIATGHMHRLNKRTARHYKKKVESMTGLRFSAGPVDADFVPRLWDLIENWPLQDPQGPPRYDDEISQAFGLRPSARAYSGSLDFLTPSIVLESAFAPDPQGDDPRQTPGIDTAPASGHGTVSPIGDVQDALEGSGGDCTHQIVSGDCDTSPGAPAPAGGHVGDTRECAESVERVEMPKQGDRPCQVPGEGQMEGETECHAVVQMTMGLKAQGDTLEAETPAPIGLARLRERPPKPLKKRNPEPEQAPAPMPDPIEQMLAAICEDWSAS